MPGFNRDSTGATDQNVVYADNVDFSGSTAPSPKVTADGQLLIGSSTTPNIRVGTLTSTGATITITNGHGTINLETAGGGGTINTIDGDSGSMTGSTVTISGGTTGLTTNAAVATMDLTGTLNVGHGGTAATSFNTNGVVISGATGTTALAAVSIVDGQVVIGSSAGAPMAATLTAGAGISITNGHNSISIAATSSAPNYTNVNNAASPYTVLAADDYISVDSSGGPVTLLFPNAPTASRTWVVKDRTGSSNTNNITITTVGGSVTIDGSTSYVLSTNFEAVNLLANSTPTYEVY